MSNTPSEENYAKAIYQLSQEKEWINTNDLARCMDLKPSSVTDMMRKMNIKKLVSYRKYKGVSLTTEGERLALRVIRKHRLWEVFLHNKLGFTWDAVHDIAEQLEHISSAELVKRLDSYLGHPSLDPHGDPIPDQNGKVEQIDRILISNCKSGAKGKLVGVYDSSASFLKFLEERKLTLGTEIEVENKHSYDDSLDILIGKSKQKLSISNEVARNLFIQID